MKRIRQTTVSAVVLVWAQVAGGQHLETVVWAPVIDQCGLLHGQLRNVQTQNQPFLRPHPGLDTGIVRRGATEMLRFPDCYTVVRSGAEYGGMYDSARYADRPVREIMGMALAEVAQRGITALEIIAFTTDSMEFHHSATCTGPMNVVEEDAECNRYEAPRVPRAYTSAGNEWLDRLRIYNESAAGRDRPLNLRLRIQPTYGVMEMVRGLYTTGSPDRVPGSLAHPNPVPRGIDANGETVENMPDISDKNVLRLLGTYVVDIIEHAEERSGTEVRSVALSLDDGRESGLYWKDENGDAMVTSVPSIGAYNTCSDFEERVAFFRKRADCLRGVYTTFAHSVHSVRPDIRAEVFYQAWVLDDDFRGTFDLYETLRGTGIDGLSHDVYCTWPFGPDRGEPVRLDTHVKWAATSHSIVERLNERFPDLHMDILSEFSWAHYDVRGGENIDWDESDLTLENAVGFDNQARAAAMYGFDGITYCNWTMHEMLEPPHIAGDPSYNLAWEKVIGPPPAGAGHVAAWRGVPELAPATRAIYLSTVGMMHGRVEAGDISSPTVYVRWFDEFGLDVTGEKVDVITDGMIADNGAIFDRYETVFMPFETSRYFARWVKEYFRSLPDGVAERILVQDAAHKPYRGGNFAYVKTWLGDPAGFRVYDDVFPRAEEYEAPEEVVASIGLEARAEPLRLHVDVTEVTGEDYFALTGRAPSLHRGDAERPVENVSFYDAVLYCNERSEREGLEPVYAYDEPREEWFDENGSCTGLERLRADGTKDGYRLPTRAEWERLYLGGTGSDENHGYYWRGGSIDAYAWWGENSGGVTHAVGRKEPNAWGLHDMAGNVMEWVWNNPGEDTTPAKGGAYFESEYALSYDASPRVSKSHRGDYIGFRVVRKASASH